MKRIFVILNPSEQIQIDSCSKIKVDEQYIEHLKKAKDEWLAICQD